MAKIASFDDVQRLLRPLYDNARTRYDLGNMKLLMKFLGNPQDSLRVIHVAGTSGKTSTCYYAAALLHAAGHTVGLTVSPHVDTINERVQVDGKPLPEKAFCSEFEIFYKLLQQSKVPASYFECMVAFAYWEFARRGVDYSVIEVGLGGLLDGTNIVGRDDKLCIITDIGLDHTEILGDTITKIAAQKAGIIQPKNDTFMYRQSGDILQAVAERVQKQHAKLHLVPTGEAVSSSLPAFQQRNLRLAAYAVSFILRRDGGNELTTENIDAAAQTVVPARMEIIEYSGKTIIIDGSHNAQKLQTLFDAVAQHFPNQAVAGLVGFVESDESRIHGALDVLVTHLRQIIVTDFVSEKDLPKRSLNAADLADRLRNLKFQAVEAISDPANAFQALLAMPEDLLVVTGSFYLLNHIRPLLKDQKK